MIGSSLTKLLTPSPLKKRRGWMTLTDMLMKLKNVHRVRSKGQVYLYHRKSKARLDVDQNGRQRSQSEIVSAWQAEEDKISGIAKNAAPGTIGSLIAAFRASPEYARLADRTRKDYSKIMDSLSSIEATPLSSLDSSMVLKIRDKAFRLHKRRHANYVVQVLSRMCSWGIPRKLIKSNPCDGVELIRKGREEPRANRPWKPSELSSVMAAVPVEMKAAIALGAYAGMRQGDVLRLPWSAYDGEAINYRQGKTGQEVWIPAHHDLRAILDETPRRSPVIVTGIKGKPPTENGFRARLFDIIRKLEKAGVVGDGLTFHGLRHTAATALAEAGCPTREIMAITGHKTEAMVAAYTKGADQRRNASAAIRRLEETKASQSVKRSDGDCKTKSDEPATD